MIYKIMIIMFAVFILPLFCIAQSSSLSEFILIKGGIFRSGDIVTNKDRSLVRVEDFEILDHPVTNSEYKIFVDAAGYPAPLHWSNNQIPAGKEDYPVIFVNRHDVDIYLKWLTSIDNRIYRLPTTVEFEYASRGGLIDKKYPWGDDNPEAKANYDSNAQRRFDRWQDYLEPARSYQSNGYGLYAMGYINVYAIGFGLST